MMRKRTCPQLRRRLKSVPSGLPQLQTREEGQFALESWASARYAHTSCSTVGQAPGV